MDWVVAEALAAEIATKRELLAPRKKPHGSGEEEDVLQYVIRSLRKDPLTLLRCRFSFKRRTPAPGPAPAGPGS